ncbi:MAG TPA: signal peptidase II [Verrucomicrobiae bacterium]|jgi:signal peptidase II
MLETGRLNLKTVTVPSILNKSNVRIAVLALVVLAIDQITKWMVVHSMVMFDERDEKVLIPGFFKFVYWGNTGAAWSMFSGNNGVLIVVMLMAILALYLTRRHFDSHTLMGQIAFGLIFGGIAGNLADRLFRHEVVDFIRFVMEQRGGGEIGFPAFNIADSAICTGVGLIFLITWKNEQTPKKVASGE